MNNRVMFMNRNIPFVSAVFSSLEGNLPQEEAARTLRGEEEKYDLKLVAPAIHGMQIIQDELTDEFVKNRLFPFLSSTHLILPPYDYDNITLVLSKDTQFSATWRGWGAIFAEWANQEKWLDYNNWHYMDFYRGLQQFQIHQYNEWRIAVLDIIKEKNNSLSIT